MTFEAIRLRFSQVKPNTGNYFNIGVVMKVAIFIVLCKLIICSEVLNENTFGSDDSESDFDVNERIKGGWKVSDTEFPHAVAIQLVWTFMRYYDCGGTIIHRWWVITVYDCFDFSYGGYFRVLAGTNKIGALWDDDENIYLIRQIFVHPDINENDLALILLDRPIIETETKRIIKIADFSMFNDTYPDHGYIAAFGETYPNGPSVSELRGARIKRIISQTSIRPKNNQSPHHFYGNRLNEGEEGWPCHGDRGAGLIFFREVEPEIRYTFLLSVLSDAIDCRMSRFTIVTNYMTWINDTITKNTPIE